MRAGARPQHLGGWQHWRRGGWRRRWRKSRCSTSLKWGTGHHPQQWPRWRALSQHQLLRPGWRSITVPRQVHHHRPCVVGWLGRQPRSTTWRWPLDQQQPRPTTLSLRQGVLCGGKRGNNKGTVQPRRLRRLPLTPRRQPGHHSACGWARGLNGTDSSVMTYGSGWGGCAGGWLVTVRGLRPTTTVGEFRGRPHLKLMLTC